MSNHLSKLTEDQRYCADLVRRYDEDWYLTAGFAPEAMRAAMYALQAFFVEVQRIPASVTEPPLGEIRLQWWREALDEVFGDVPMRAHPVVKALGETLPVSTNHTLRRVMRETIDATGFLMTGMPFKDLSQMTSFFEDAYGHSVEALAIMLSPGELPESVRHILKTAGGNFALVRQRATATGQAATNRQVPLAADRVAAFWQTDPDRMLSELSDRVRLDRAALQGLDAAIMPAAAHLGLMQPLWRKCVVQSGSALPATLSPLKKRFILTKTVLMGRF